MKLLVNCVLVLVLAFTFCQSSFGQTTDCESASKFCKEVCGAAKITDKNRGGNVGESDFKEHCERSCSAGADSCKIQDSKNDCSTFYYHCVSACPWTVTDTQGNYPVEK